VLQIAALPILPKPVFAQSGRVQGPASVTPLADGNGPTPAKNYASTCYSGGLDGINRGKVKFLQAALVFSLYSCARTEVGPNVGGDTLYAFSLLR
jgi:hypothetical protein